MLMLLLLLSLVFQVNAFNIGMCVSCRPSPSIASSSVEATGGPRRAFIHKLLAGGLAIGLKPSVSSAAEESAGAEAVCTNFLGCPIPGGKLPPPRKIYKDIFEEERDLARMAEEKAAQELMERRKAEFLVVQAQFAVVRKGAQDLKKELDQVISEAASDNLAALDDLRRLSRAYNTAIRMDAMEPVLDRMRKLKLQFDDSVAKESMDKLTRSLQNLDRAGRSQDAALATSSLKDAISAAESFLLLAPKAKALLDLAK